EPEFIQLLGEEVYLPVPKQFLGMLKLMKLKMKDDKASLNELLRVAAQGESEKMTDFRERVGAGVQNALRHQFENYELPGKTWAKLTKAKDSRLDAGGSVSEYV